MKLAREKKIKVDWFRSRKKVLTENKLEDENDQALTSGDDGDRLILLRMNMSLSRSSVSESVSFCLKLKF